MMKRNKFLSKTGFYYYNLLVFITRGNKRFVDKKLIFGALIIGLTSQYGCNSKNTDNNTLVNDKDSIRDEATLCYKPVVGKADTLMQSETQKVQTNIKTNRTVSFITCYNPKPLIETSQNNNEALPELIDLAVKKELNIEKLDTLNANEYPLASCYTMGMPEFPGGEEKLMKFLKDNLKYPQIARDSNIQGTVYVGFVIENDGKISDVKVLRGISKECDAEAVRVIKTIPKWKPGKRMEKPVQFNMPIKFKLDDGKK
ncbi:MAG: energy transducer TonB [Bacteroidales bacterium]